MEQYIDKATIVAEIERLKECNRKICGGDFDFLKKTYPKHYYSTEIYNDILSFINTLDVKEVDLEKEIYDAEKRFGDIDEMGGYRILIFDDDFRDILRHFFELGLKVQKGE